MRRLVFPRSATRPDATKPREAITSSPPPDPAHDSAAIGAEVAFRLVERGDLTDAEIASMLDLLAKAFGRWPKVAPGVTPADHLRWKTSSPFALCSAVLGESGDTLVTTDTAMGYGLRLRGEDVIRVQFVDHAVRPEFRGRGVSSASIAFRQRAVAPRYALSISDAQSPTMIHRAVKFGTRRFGNEVHPLLLPLRPREFAARWTRGRGLPGWMTPPIELALEARGALPARRRRSARASEARIVPVDRFDGRIDRFFAVAGEPWDLIVVRSRAHLDWRYCDPRGGDYSKRVAEDGSGAILGYAIATQIDGHAFLVDLLALPGRADVVFDLATALVSDLERAGCIDVLCWLQERHPFRDALRRAGFLDARERPTVTFRHANVEPADLAFLTEPGVRLHYMLGDTDLV
jgi:hypothetical protein